LCSKRPYSFLYILAPLSHTGNAATAAIQLLDCVPEEGNAVLPAPSSIGLQGAGPPEIPEEQSGRIDIDSLRSNQTACSFAENLFMSKFLAL